jgi:cytochrome c-type biogenesis protein CcmH/NrfG
VIARAAIAIAALLVAVWLVSGLRPVRDERAGIAAVQAQDVPRGYRLLERAAAHSRSTQPDLRLAQLDAFTKQPDRAVTRLQALVRREPENYEAWVLLAQTAATVDPPLAKRARARARVLSPPVPADR